MRLFGHSGASKPSFDLRKWPPGIPRAPMQTLWTLHFLQQCRNPLALQGALGLGGDTNEYEPELVMEGSLVKVGAGHYHSFCIDGDGRLWSWG